MKSVDLSKDIAKTIFRGANEGIEIMCGGSFYSYEQELATEYAEMEENPCLYAFDVTGLNFLIVEDNCDIDDGVDGFEKEEIEMYDGVRTKNYAQVLMFGTFNCVTGEFKKQSFEDLINDANKEFRRYDR